MQQLAQNGVPYDAGYYSLITKFAPSQMNWILLQNEQQLEEIKIKSAQFPQIIFKHSTRCGTSSIAKRRLENKEAPHGADFYYLDVIRHRNISNKIASDFHTRHESPQILIIENNICTYNESHWGIDMDEIKANIAD